MDASSEQKTVLVHEGALEVHGRPKLSWTSLAATVPKTSREEIKSESIYSVADTDTLAGSGIFIVEFDSFGNQVRNWGRAIKPIKFTRLTANIGNVVLVAVKRRAYFGKTFSPEDIVEGFEDLCYGGQRTSAMRSLVTKERTAFAAICHIGFPGNSTEVEGTLTSARSETGLLVKRIGDVEFAAMSVVSLSGSTTAHRVEMLSYPAGGVSSLDRILTTVDSVSSWKPGDRIVLASTDYDHNQAEEFDVQECASCTEFQVKIRGPVLYTHWGEITDGVDMRAELGVLTRNVRFRGEMETACYGDNLCNIFDYDTFGGQIKIMKGVNAVRIANAELSHMGQQPVIGSYPIHFHMCLDTSGKDVYIRHNSIHNTFSRCLTIHGTHNVTVEGNIAYNNIGHCFFVEDGGEQHNKFISNLGLCTRPGTLLPTDQLNQVSTFWIPNPDNQLINNRAAGSDGIGIWILMTKFPTGPSADVDMGLKHGQSLSTLIPDFHGNKVHSNRKTGLLFDRLLLENGSVKVAKYKPLENASDPDSPPALLHLDDLTAYKNFEAVWIKSFWTHCTNFRLGENSIGLTFASAEPANPGFHYEMLANSRVVGETNNKGEPAGVVTLDSGDDLVLDRSLPRMDIRHAQLGVVFYRGPVSVQNTSFAGFKSNELRYAGAIGKKPANKYFSSPIASVRNVSFDFSDPDEGSRFFDGDGSILRYREEDGNRHNVLLDADGSLTGVPGTSIVRPIRLLMNSRCVLMPTWGVGTGLCPDRFSRLKLSSDAGLIPTFMTRNDLMSSTTETPLAERQISYSLNTRESYILHFNTTVPGTFKLVPYGLQLGLQQVVGVCVGADQTFTVRPSTYTPTQNMTELKNDDSNSKYLYDSAAGVITFRFTSRYPRGENTLSHCPGELDGDLNGVCETNVVIKMSAPNDDGDCRQRAYPAYQTAPVSAEGGLTVPGVLPASS